MRKIILLATFIVFAAAIAAGAVVSTTVTLTSGSNSSVDIDTASGLYNWSVEGANQANSSWYWYRIGDTGPESPISALGAPVVTPVGTDMATLTYSGSGFDFSVMCLLTGGGSGSGTSDLYQSVMITNHNTTDLNLHVFEYSDFNLGGTAGNDSAFFASGSMTQTDGGSAATLASTATQPNGVQISLTPTLVDALGDGSTTVLGSSPAPVNNGDIAYGYQWNFVVAKNGGAQSFSEDKLIAGIPVPEPGSLLSLCAGGLALAATYRRRR